MHTLNGNPHYFGKHPQEIVWLQIAGFSEEHLAMLRFGQNNSLEKTMFERASCVGKIWNYNLYDLRPTAHQSFMAQILGKKNITGSCEDSKKRPLWSYLEETGYQIGFFEVGAGKNNSMEDLYSCKKSTHFKKNLMSWFMRDGKGKGEIFHYQEKKNFRPGVVYYDKSCVNNICYAGLFNNISSIYPRFRQEASSSFFLLRDYSYQEALKNKDIKKARQILTQLGEVMQYFNEVLKERDALFLVTSAASKGLEFPLEGRQWFQFEKDGGNLFYRRPLLMSSVLASGAGAEHFCGIFEESEIFSRILWFFKKSRLN